MYKKLIVSILFIVFTVKIFAQPKDNSPASRFGIGNYFPSYFTAPGGMGGLTAAYRDLAHMNFVNPASLASLYSTSFEGGVFGKYARLTADTISANVWTGNLQYLALGFPMQSPINEVFEKKKSPLRWGMGLVLQPYTLVGYDIEDSGPHPGIDSITVKNGYQGRGGTYKLMWGNGLKYKNLSFGWNLGYLFGKITNERQVTFENLENPYSDIFLDEISVGGFIWNAGAQYDLRLDKKKKDELNDSRTKHLVVGLYGNSNQNFRTNTSRLWRRVSVAYSDIDTIVIANDSIAHGTLPSELGIGFMFDDINRFRIGANYSMSGWSNYLNEAKPETLSNTWSFSVGAEYIPDYAAFNKYSKRMRYRLGGFYGLDPRTLNGEQLRQWGVTAGIGLPVVLARQSPSYLDFSLEYGGFGIPTLQEKYIKLTFGYTLTDNTWFFTRRFE